MIYEMGSFMVTIIIPETPIEYVIIACLLVVIIRGRLGLETILRSAQIFIPWFIGLYLLLIFLNLSNATFENLQPLFERGKYLIIKGNFSIISYLFISNNTYLGNYISSTWISHSITRGFLFPLCSLILSWGKSKLRN